MQRKDLQCTMHKHIYLQSPRFVYVMQDSWLRFIPEWKLICLRVRVPSFERLRCTSPSSPLRLQISARLATEQTYLDVSPGTPWKPGCNTRGGKTGYRAARPGRFLFISGELKAGGIAYVYVWLERSYDPSRRPLWTACVHCDSYPIDVSHLSSLQFSLSTGTLGIYLADSSSRDLFPHPS